jgi:hypothetical protein
MEEVEGAKFPDFSGLASLAADESYGWHALRWTELRHEK